VKSWNYESERGLSGGNCGGLSEPEQDLDFAWPEMKRGKRIKTQSDKIDPCLQTEWRRGKFHEDADTIQTGKHLARMRASCQQEEKEITGSRGKGNKKKKAKNAPHDGV